MTALLFVAALPLAAATLDDAALRRIFAAVDTRVAELAVGPHGRQVAAVVRTAPAPYRDDFVGLGTRRLDLIDLTSRTIRTLVGAGADAHRPAWSPDGRRIAFFSRGAAGFELSVITVATGRRIRVATITGPARNPVGEAAEIVWSDDGRTLLYAVQPDIPWTQHFIERAAIAPAMLEGPVVVDGSTRDAPLLRSQGLRGELFVETAKELRLSQHPNEVVARVRENERLIALTAEETLLRSGREIVALRLSDATRRTVMTAAGDIVLTRRDRDRTLLIVSRTAEEWIVASGERALGRVPARHGARVVGCTAHKLVVIEEAGTIDRLLEIDLRTNAVRPLLHGVVHQATVIDETNVLAVTAAVDAPELVRVVGAEERRIGHWPGVDASALAGVSAEVVSWTSDGNTIEGLLLLPAGKHTGVLLFLHGGPESRATADAHYLNGPIGGYAAILARSGHAVLLPNFRGSTGYGRGFGKDLGNGNLFRVPAADSLAGIDALVDRGVADRERIGIYGFSFGAMLTAWIVGRDHRFRAAAISAATLDLLADDRARLRGDRAFHAYAPDRAGPDDHLLDQWRRPEKYRELSPIERAPEIRTPTLLMSTAAEQLAGTDYPAFFNALRVRQVPVRWAYYPSAWHGGSWSTPDRLDSVRRLIAWFGLR